MPSKTDTSQAQYRAKSVKPFRVQSDPRPTGPLCICGCGRERLPVAVLHEDPFASTDCCRAYYSNPRPDSAGVVNR